MSDGVIIPVATFVPVQALSGNPWSMSSYAIHMATEALIYMAVEYLGISRYQLGRLLGYKNRSHIYALLAGRRRPGQLFVARLAWLIWLRSQGVEPMRWRSIDWETGEILLRSAPRKAVGAASK
jgi:hypothetical protein